MKKDITGLTDIILKTLEQNNGYCMDMPAERKKLCAAIMRALKDYEGYIACLKHGADMLSQSREVVHLPDAEITITGGHYYIEPGELESGQDIKEEHIGGLIRYLADMVA